MSSEEEAQETLGKVEEDLIVFSTYFPEVQRFLAAYRHFKCMGHLHSEACRRKP